MVKDMPSMEGSYLQTTSRADSHDFKAELLKMSLWMMSIIQTSINQKHVFLGGDLGIKRMMDLIIRRSTHVNNFHAINHL